MKTSPKGRWPIVSMVVRAIQGQCLMIYPLSVWKQRWDSYIILLVREENAQGCENTASRPKGRQRSRDSRPAHPKRSQHPTISSPLDSGTPLFTPVVDCCRAGALRLHRRSLDGGVPALIRLRLSGGGGVVAECDDGAVRRSGAPAAAAVAATATPARPAVPPLGIQGAERTSSQARAFWRSSEEAPACARALLPSSPQCA